MIEALRNWIINICTIIIFVTAVDMLLPSNSIKKYAKYVLGLILIVTLIKPIIIMAKGDFEINKYINYSNSYFNTDTYESEYEKYKEQNVINTVNNFKTNLEISLEKKLKNKFNHSEFDVYIDLTYEKDTNDFNIDSVEVEVSDKSISRIEEIKIGKSSDNTVERKLLNNEMSKNIKDYISSELQISNSIISVYKL